MNWHIADPQYMSDIIIYIFLLDSSSTGGIAMEKNLVDWLQNITNTPTELSLFQPDKNYRLKKVSLL